MKIFKKLLVFIFVIILCTSVSQAAPSKVIKKEFQVQTKDLRVIKATLSYIKIDGIKKYPTVLLLHSIGYSSEDWGSLPKDLINAGYAVITMDLRGHGKSIYDSNLKPKPWIYFTTKAYQKIPDDVVAIINQSQKESKLVDANNMAIVGADIGANAAILASKDLKTKPRTLVLISPTTTFKGLYTPIAIAEMGYIPILAIASNKDRYCLQEELKLSKFAQGGFYAKNYPQGGMGMMMLKVNPTMSMDIVKWIMKYAR